MSRATIHAHLLIVAALISHSASAASQETATIRRVDVFLNGQFLATAHAHVRSGTARIAIDQSCVEFREIARLVGGSQFLVLRGRNLDAVRVGAGRGAALRVLRSGRISSRVHRSGDELYIPLLDFVRALGATVVPGRSDRVNLYLDSPPLDALLGPNDRVRRP